MDANSRPREEARCRKGNMMIERQQAQVDAGRRQRGGGLVSTAVVTVAIVPRRAANFWLTGYGFVAGRGRCVMVAGCRRRRHAQGRAHGAAHRKHGENGEHDQADGPLPQHAHFLSISRMRAIPGARRPERSEYPPMGHRVTRRRRNALAITETELKLIAAAAIIGLRSTPKNGYSTPAAIGTPAAL